MSIFVNKEGAREMGRVEKVITDVLKSPVSLIIESNKPIGENFYTPTLTRPILACFKIF